MLQAIGEVGGVGQAKRCRGEDLFFLAAAGDLLHQRGRIPLAETHRQAFPDEPAVQQSQLRALARPVDAFHGNESPGKSMLRVAKHSVTFYLSLLGADSS